MRIELLYVKSLSNYFFLKSSSSFSFFSGGFDFGLSLILFGLALPFFKIECFKQLQIIGFFFLAT